MGTIEEFKKDVDAEAAKPVEAPLPETDKPKAEDPFDGAPDGDNKDYKAVASLVNEIEAEQAKIDKINEDAKKLKAPHQDTISVLRKRIKDEQGIESKPLALVVSERRTLRRIEERKNNLDETQSHQFKQMTMAI